ncbi:MAG: CcmD family protein [Chloroflexi bacterium]|nr:CcmD family protein [Chloroflexota bacterium]
MKSIKQFPFAHKLVFAALVMSALLASYAAFGGITAYASSVPAEPTIEVVVAPQVAEEARKPEANLPYLFAVFIITWALMFGYVFYMSRRQRTLRNEIEALKSVLNEKQGVAGKPARAEVEVQS